MLKILQIFREKGKMFVRASGGDAGNATAARLKILYMYKISSKTA